MNSTVSNIALKFSEIENNDFRNIVRFCEENDAVIQSLDDIEKNYYCYEYLMALFNLGRYNEVLAAIDSLIEFVFLEGVNYGPGNTFEWLIFKKSAALLNTRQTAQSLQFARDLVRMRPGNKDYRSLFSQTVKQDVSNRYKPARTAAIICILTAALISMFAWSLYQTVDPEEVKYLFGFSVSLNVLAIGILSWNYVKVYFTCKFALRDALRGIK